MARRKANRLGDALARVLSKKGLREGLRLEGVRQKWRQAVGEDLAARTRVVSFQRGVLRVEVQSSALLQELASIYKEGLTRSLATGDSPLAVRDIHFRLPG